MPLNDATKAPVAFALCASSSQRGRLTAALEDRGVVGRIFSS